MSAKWRCQFVNMWFLHLKCGGWVGACAMEAQVCFVSPTHPPLKQNRIMDRSKQTIWICIQKLGSSNPISQSEKVWSIDSPVAYEQKDWLHPFLHSCTDVSFEIAMSACLCFCFFLGFHVFSVFTANDVCDVCMNKITCERRILIYDDICLRPHARLYASKLPCYDPLCYVLSCVTLAARFVPVCSVRTLADLVLCVGTHTTPWFERSSKL